MPHVTCLFVLIHRRTVDTRTASSLSRLNDDIKHQDGSCQAVRMFMCAQRREALRGTLCNLRLVVLLSNQDLWSQPIEPRDTHKYALLT
jgi:hypothetical protein